MAETDRVVIIAAGFGVWLERRNVASARWTDVARVRLLAHVPAAVEVTLVDGRVLALSTTLRGLRPWLQVAAEKLPGVPLPEEWWPAGTLPTVAADRELFARRRGDGVGTESNRVSR